jgi:hypothetical protein
MVTPPATAAAPSRWKATWAPSKYHKSEDSCTREGDERNWPALGEGDRRTNVAR